MSKNCKRLMTSSIVQFTVKKEIGEGSTESQSNCIKYDFEEVP